MPWFCRTKQRRCSTAYYTVCWTRYKAKGGQVDREREGRAVLFASRFPAAQEKSPCQPAARVFPYVSLRSCLKYSLAASHRGAKVSPGDGRSWNPDTLSKKHDAQWRLPHAFNVFNQYKASTSTGEKLEGFSHLPPGLPRTARSRKSRLIEEAIHTGSHLPSLPAPSTANAAPVSMTRPA